MVQTLQLRVSHKACVEVSVFRGEVKKRELAQAQCDCRRHLGYVVLAL